MARSRLKVGVDVPWVTSWTAETEMRAGACSSVGGRLAVLQAEAPGEGRPLYSKNHFLRQRLSVAQMLCPMCGTPTTAGDRITLTARRTTARRLRTAGLSALLPPDLPDAAPLVDAGAIAPLHAACADRAHRLCPHLAGLEGARPTPFPDRWFTAPLMMPVMPPGGVVLAQAQARRPAVGFLQLIGVEQLGRSAVPHRRVRARTGI